MNLKTHYQVSGLDSDFIKSKSDLHALTIGFLEDRRDMDSISYKEESRNTQESRVTAW